MRVARTPAGTQVGSKSSHPTCCVTSDDPHVHSAASLDLTFSPVRRGQSWHVHCRAAQVSIRDHDLTTAWGIRVVCSFSLFLSAPQDPGGSSQGSVPGGDTARKTGETRASSSRTLPRGCLRPGQCPQLCTCLDLLFISNPDTSPPPRLPGSSCHYIGDARKLGACGEGSGPSHFL